MATLSVDDSGVQGNGGSHHPSFSTDARFVAFDSDAYNLVGGDTNLAADVFVRDRSAGRTTRVSVNDGGTQGLGSSDRPSISADGRHVAFESDASNLVTGDTNGSIDIFIRDRQYGTTDRVSVDSSGVQGSGASGLPSITADGRSVSFQSAASNLVIGDTNFAIDVFVRDHGVASTFEAFCFGDGTAGPCPCSNSGSPGHGCQNSSTTGGAILTVTGLASLADDSVQFTSSGEKPTALSIFLQGTLVISPANYGDGLRCTGGSLKRLYNKSAVGGVVVAPQSGDLSVSARSAALSAPIPLGSTRVYQVYYRDPVAGYCPSPQGSTFNVSSAIAVAWGS